MEAQPYLFFEGRCEEAIEFYKEALGARVEMLMRIKDSPEPPQDPHMQKPGTENKIMHAAVTIGDSTVFASDGRCEGKPEFKGFALSLTVPDQAAADRTFGALRNGATVIMPLGKTFFSPAFGMLTDRFGVTWMVYVKPQQP